VTGLLPSFSAVITKVPGDVPVGTTRVAVVGYRLEPEPPPGPLVVFVIVVVCVIV